MTTFLLCLGAIFVYIFLSKLMDKITEKKIEASPYDSLVDNVISSMLLEPEKWDVNWYEMQLRGSEISIRIQDGKSGIRLNKDDTLPIHLKEKLWNAHLEWKATKLALSMGL